MHYGSKYQQRGVSLVGLIVILAIIGMIAVLGMKVVPTVIEYNSIKKAIVSAKSAGSTVREIQTAFNRQAEVGYIDSIQGKDLDISKDGDQVEVSFAYQKKIALFAPVSLLIEYSGTTANKSTRKAVE
jgi:type II secretory pathway pseudopilin PulG